ncbi:MAG: radical SAM protein [Acidobacteriota bacterium]
MPANFRPNLLSIVPPYDYFVPPHGIASLMGALKAQGCDAFDVLDLRLWSPVPYLPTYVSTGAFGETFVIDIPDLPLVLQLLASLERPGRAFDDRSVVTRFALERGLSPDRLAGYLHATDRFLERAWDNVADIRFVGFSVWSSNFLTTLMAAAHLKRRRSPPFVVFGGPQTTQSMASAQLALRSGLADAVVLGEGEQTLIELFEAFEHAGGEPGPVAGCMQRAADGAIVTTERRLGKLHDKPLPDFSALPIEIYQRSGLSGLGSRRRILPFEISRGCTDRCAFCSEWVFWERFRSARPDEVLEQMKELKERYDADGFFFSDSLLNGVPYRLTALAEGILSMNLDVTWGGFFRAAMDRETARLIKRSGCEHAFLGIESMSDDTLERMNKRRTQADNIQALHAFLEAGVSFVCAGLIPGFPGDTRERFTQTALELHALQQRYPTRFRVNKEPFTVLAAQPLLDDLEGFGLVAHGWPDEVLDLAPSYRDITEPILCHVSGDNQGLERVGQTTIANSFNALDQWNDRGAIDWLPDHGIVRQSLGDGWSLAHFLSPSGARCALLASDDECEQLDARRRRAGGEQQIREEFADWVADLHAAHWVAPPLDMPELAPLGLGACGAARNGSRGDGERFVLSPFVVGRRAEGGLLVACWHTARLHRLAPDFEPVVAALRHDAMTRTAIRRMCRARGLDGVSAESALEALRRDELVMDRRPGDLGHE